MTANYRDFNNQEFVKGLKFLFNDSSQKDNLIDLIKVYTSRFSEEYAKTYKKEMVSHGFENTTFALGRFNQNFRRTLLFYKT
ncbi:MAG: hypothetical protein Ct9H90mP2_02350 [Dehalococcoidia bacterium]|nr:MAG: hypothetical protein Ct9H90mP2_02350 [Dehalococcoidia bacterium]